MTTEAITNQGEVTNINSPEAAGLISHESESESLYLEFVQTLLISFGVDANDLSATHEDQYRPNTDNLFNGYFDDLNEDERWKAISQTMIIVASKNQTLGHSGKETIFKDGLIKFPQSENSVDEIVRVIDYLYDNERQITQAIYASYLQSNPSEKANYPNFLAAAGLQDSPLNSLVEISGALITNAETKEKEPSLHIYPDLALASCYPGQFCSIQEGADIGEIQKQYPGPLSRLIRLAVSVGALRPRRISSENGDEITWEWHENSENKPKIPFELVIGANLFDLVGMPLEVIICVFPDEFFFLIDRLKSFVDFHLHGDINTFDPTQRKQRLSIINKRVAPKISPGQPLTIVEHATNYQAAENTDEQQTIEEVSPQLTTQLSKLIKENPNLRLALENNYLHLNGQRVYMNGAEFGQIIGQIVENLSGQLIEGEVIPSFAITLDIAHFNCADGQEVQSTKDVIQHLTALKQSNNFSPAEIIVHLSQNKAPDATGHRRDNHLGHLYEGAQAIGFEETQASGSESIGVVKLAECTSLITTYCQENNIPVTLVSEQSANLEQTDIDYLKELITH